MISKTNFVIDEFIENVHGAMAIKLIKKADV